MDSTQFNFRIIIFHEEMTTTNYTKSHKILVRNTTNIFNYAVKEILCYYGKFCGEVAFPRYTESVKFSSQSLKTA